jgi:bifunctional non-homologous end joining protein LigD
MHKVRPRSAFVAPCIPTRARKPPAGPAWVHEITHDGYRLQVRRDGDAVRLCTRKGYDWSDGYPAIAATAMMVPAHSCTLTGRPASSVQMVARPCCTRSTCWSSTTGICADCP